LESRKKERLFELKMVGAFTLVLVLAGLGAAFAIPVLVIPALFAPKNPTPMKLATFEAGQIPTGATRVHLMMQYYAYILMFVVFDVLAIFLFAWGATSLATSSASIYIIILFLLINFIPMGYALYLAEKREIW
jgi:NADH:ubiquinone oxidoreductase subunit 3 (subunit A)